MLYFPPLQYFINHTRPEVVVNIMHEPSIRGANEYTRLMKQHHRVVITSLAPHVVQYTQKLLAKAKMDIPIVWFLDVLPWAPLPSVADPEPIFPCHRMKRRSAVLKPECLGGFVTQVRLLAVNHESSCPFRECNL